MLPAAQPASHPQPGLAARQRWPRQPPAAQAAPASALRQASRSARQCHQLAAGRPHQVRAHLCLGAFARAVPAASFQPDLSAASETPPPPPSLPSWSLPSIQSPRPVLICALACLGDIILSLVCHRLPGGPHVTDLGSEFKLTPQSPTVNRTAAWTAWWGPRPQGIRTLSGRPPRA